MNLYASHCRAQNDDDIFDIFFLSAVFVQYNNSRTHNKLRIIYDKKFLTTTKWPRLVLFIRDGILPKYIPTKPPARPYKLDNFSSGFFI